MVAAPTDNARCLLGPIAPSRTWTKVAGPSTSARSLTVARAAELAACRPERASRPPSPPAPSPPTWREASCSCSSRWPTPTTSCPAARCSAATPGTARPVRGLAPGLCRALGDIHGAGLVHRDLKSSNVMVTIDGPKVIDFGIVRALDGSTTSGLTSTGVVIGSPGFMAPEQILGERLTPASDIFSLGAVLAFAASGRLPFDAGRVSHLALVLVDAWVDRAEQPQGTGRRRRLPVLTQKDGRLRAGRRGDQATASTRSARTVLPVGG
ncbi:protein kinase [Streptomyces thermocarboxydus]|nr:protein kinase [Streptomyces thermocarboxydus]